MELIIYSLFLINATWIYFCAIMRLQQVRDAGQLNGIMKLIAYPNLAIGLVLDTLLNWTVCTVVFLELPREFLTTTRLCRLYVPGSDAWRSRLADWFGRMLLNPIDPDGIHVD